MPDVGLSMPRERRRTPEGYVRGHSGTLMKLPPAPIRKEDAECCMSQVDDLGRPPIGYCSPTCIRRPEIQAMVAEGLIG